VSYFFLRIAEGFPALSDLSGSLLERGSRISMCRYKTNVRIQRPFGFIWMPDRMGMFSFVFRSQNTTFRIFLGNFVGAQFSDCSIVIELANLTLAYRSLMVSLTSDTPSAEQTTAEQANGKFGADGRHTAFSPSERALHCAATRLIFSGAVAPVTL